MSKIKELALKHWHYIIPIVLSWIWFASIQGASFERIRTLGTVEPYALAVYDQLAWNFADSGRFFQTIHFGYDDAWTWSGHRAVFLPIVSWIYGISPGPIWLCRIQILILSFGGITAYLLGRQAIGGVLGGISGSLLYLLYPPLMVIALNDYQDVILGVPFLIGTIWAAREGRTLAFVIMAALTCFAREEWILMVPLLGLSATGGVKERGKWVVIGGLVALGVGIAAFAVGGSTRGGHDNPMASHMSDLFTWPLPITRSWADVDAFYLEFLKPLHFLAVLAPSAWLPALGPLFFHLTAPADGGVDTNFSHHVHHMAPVAAFVIAGAILGLGFLNSLMERLLKSKIWIMRLGVAILIAGVGWTYTAPWLSRFRITPRLTLSVPLDRPPAPQWILAAKAPRDAIIATDAASSLTVSSRRESYTYDESLSDKAPRKGLKAVEWLMVRRAHTPWITLAKAWPGAEVKGEAGEYILFHLPDSGRGQLPPGPLFPSEGRWAPTTPGQPIPDHTP